MQNEQVILQQCKKGDREAQKKLYYHYAPLMKGVCVRYAIDREDAKDILQEGFIKAFSKIEQFSGKGSIEGWIRKIMVNTAINHNKKNKKQYQQESIDHSNENRVSSLGIEETKNDESKYIDRQDVDSDQVDFNMINDANFSYHELLEVLEAIPNAFSVVFNLFVIEEYKHDEISKLLGIDVKTSRSRFFRAKKMIQTILHRRTIEKLCK